MSTIILMDQMLILQPFRAVILQGPTGRCANLGVVNSQYLPAMRGIQLDCFGGVTYRGFGDGEVLDANFFWFGWDFGLLDSPNDLPLSDSDDPESDSALALLKSESDPDHEWSLAEIEQEISVVAKQLETRMASI